MEIASGLQEVVKFRRVNGVRICPAVLPGEQKKGAPA